MKRDAFPTAHLAYEITARLGVPPYSPELGAACSIPFPPTWTDLALGGIELNSLLGLIEVAPMDACGIFNEFVYLYIAKVDGEPEIPAGVWMAEKLGTQNAGLTLRSVTDPVEVGALFLDACRMHFEVDHEKHRMVVTSDDGVFGFMNGEVVTPVTDLQIPYPDTNFIEIFQQSHNRRPGRCRTIAFNRLWIKAHRHPDREPLLLALAIMYWRTPRTRDLVKWFYPL